MALRASASSQLTASRLAHRSPEGWVRSPPPHGEEAAGACGVDATSTGTSIYTRHAVAEVQRAGNVSGYARQGESFQKQASTHFAWVSSNPAFLCAMLLVHFRTRGPIGHSGG